MEQHADWVQEVRVATTSAALEDIRVRILGKQGLLTQQLKQLGSLSHEERKTKGAEWNALRQELENLLRERLDHVQEAEMDARLSSERIDVTLPPMSQPLGRSHILSRMLRDVTRYFAGLGFTTIDGPEMDDAYHNFDALNIPPLHPSRQSHDTFYIAGGRLLRTHTSAVQIRALKAYAKKPEGELRCLSIGRVYRSDAIDATHTPMFHQIEGILVGESIHFGHLKSCVSDFCAWFFGKEKVVRFRPSFFPFTEPSAEVDISFKDTWLELLGCGMVHPDIIERAGLDPNTYQGFAFGAGLERLTMLRHGLTDIRHVYETDVRWLAQAP